MNYFLLPDYMVRNIDEEMVKIAISDEEYFHYPKSLIKGIKGARVGMVKMLVGSKFNIQLVTIKAVEFGKRVEYGIKYNKPLKDKIIATKSLSKRDLATLLREIIPLSEAIKHYWGDALNFSFTRPYPSTGLTLEYESGVSFLIQKIFCDWGDKLLLKHKESRGGFDGLLNEQKHDFLTKHADFSLDELEKCFKHYKGVYGRFSIEDLVKVGGLESKAKLEVQQEMVVIQKPKKQTSTYREDRSVALRKKRNRKVG